MRTDDSMGSRLDAIAKIAACLVAAVIMLAGCTGCLKPPAKSHSATSETAPIHPSEYYAGYWLCLGYTKDGKTVAYDSLGSDERRRLPHLVMRLEEGGSAQVTYYSSDVPGASLLAGRWEAAGNGVRVDSRDLGGDDVVDFSLEGELLTLGRDGVAALERGGQLFFGNGFSLPPGGAELHFARQTVGNELYVSPITYDGITLEAPSDVTYLYDAEAPGEGDTATASSFRDRGPSLTFSASPTDAANIVEVVAASQGQEYCVEHPEIFREHDGLYFAVRDGRDSHYYEVEFVANGKVYSVLFEYPEGGPIDYSDYAERFLATIRVGDEGQGAHAAAPAGSIPWQEAPQHVGETVTVYGPVAEVNYAAESEGQPTFVDLGVAYPADNRVTMIVWGEDRGAFPGPPEELYASGTLCVTGEVYLHEGVCNIKVTSPSQVQTL